MLAGIINQIMLQLLFLVSSYASNSIIKNIFTKIAHVAKYVLHGTDCMTTANNNDVTQCSQNLR